MKIKVTFKHKGQHVYERDAEKLDRNYDDESYALFFVERPFKKDDYYEINILKDEDGNLIPKGYVAYYEHIDDIDYGNLFYAKIEFIC